MSPDPVRHGRNDYTARGTRPDPQAPPGKLQPTVPRSCDLSQCLQAFCAVAHRQSRYSATRRMAACSAARRRFEQLRRAAESQLRFLVEHPHESLIAIREFQWAEGDALTVIHERRRRYRTTFEDLLVEGVEQGRMSVSNTKIAAFAIIEMAEGVPRWFRLGRQVSINHPVDRAIHVTGSRA
jgi:hypothetical protein